MSKPRLYGARARRRSKAAKARTTLDEINEITERNAKPSDARDELRATQAWVRYESTLFDIHAKLATLAAAQKEAAASVSLIQGDIAQIQKYVGVLAGKQWAEITLHTVYPPPTADGANMRGGTGVYPGEAGYVPPWHEVPPR